MQRGFSLVELSIVLVILGLLTGGILAGQSLIRASELRAVGTEYNRYQTAVRSFQDKYFAIPGDMTNAQSFWGVAHATPATCSTTQGTGTQTCNGNGDGRIYHLSTVNEIFRFWQHLANAGLIEGSYTGIAGPANAIDSSPGVNIPSSKFGNAGWGAYSGGDYSGHPKVYDGNYDNIFILGSEAATSFSEGLIFKGEEAWNIDTKMDDGRPALGKIRTYGNDANCTTGMVMTATYALNGTGPACMLMFGNRSIF